MRSSPPFSRALFCPLVFLFVVAMSGCGGGPSLGTFTLPPPTPTPVTTDPAVVAKSIFYGDTAKEMLDVYAANVGGTAPIVTSYPLSNGPHAVTGDAAGNIYMAQDTATAGNVVEIPASTSVTARTIQLPSPAGTAVNQIETMTTDAAGNLYVATATGTIFVYGPTANGAATPTRTIAGPLTLLVSGIAGISQMAVDAKGDLYAAVGGGYKGSMVVMFAPDATGNVAPTPITSANYLPTGVALDVTGNIYIAQSITEQSTTGFPDAVYEFPAGSTAGAAPTRAITGDATGFAFDLYNIQVDAAGNIFTLQYTGISGEDIVVFGAKADGNVAPAMTLLLPNGASTASQFYLK